MDSHHGGPPQPRPRAGGTRSRLRAWGVLGAAAAGFVAAGVVGMAFAAAPGDLDSGFGSDGKVVTGVSRHGDDRAHAVALQADGKVVAAGVSDGRFAVARYHADDGALDPTFGGDGIVTTSFGEGLQARANAVAIAGDGKIVVAGMALPPFDLGGQSPGDFALARYNGDGTLDTTFSGDGKVTTPVDPGGGNDEINDIAIEAGNKVVAVGQSSPVEGPPDFVVARYGADGTLDTGFDDDGKQTVDFTGDFEGARAVALQPSDGKIVVAGSTSTLAGGDAFALARLDDADGSLDTTFSGDGKVASDDFGHAANDVAVEPGGDIIAAGVVTDFDVEDVEHNDIALARFDPDGTPDAGFGGGDGAVRTDLGDNDWANALSVVSGGTIVVAGTSGSTPFGEAGFGAAPDGDVALAYYSSDGSLNTDLDEDGTLTDDFGAGDAAHDVLVQADGKIVVAGLSQLADTPPDATQEQGPASDFMVARYNADGTRDDQGTFDGDGIANTLIGNAFGDRANALAVQDDGKVVVAGSTIDENGADDSDTVVARYNRDGTLDPTFGGSGFVALDLSLGDLHDAAGAVAIQDDGKIVVAGGASDDFMVARLTSGGILDGSFDGNGVLTTDFGPGDLDTASAVVVQPDGRIVVGGSSVVSDTGPSALALARYLPNGAPDASFGTGGTATDATAEFAAALALQPDGRIVVAAAADTGFAVDRYTSTGGADGTFGGGSGRVSTDFGTTSGTQNITDVAVQPDGAIVAAGFAGHPDAPIADCGGIPDTDVALARYTPAGAPDTTFDGNGRRLTDFGGGSDQGYGVALQPDGTIVAAGRSNSDFAAGRHQPGGALDTTFSGDGLQTTDLGAGGCDVARDVALTPDGIVLAGSAADAEGRRIAVIRYARAADDGASASVAAGGTLSTGGTLSESNPIMTSLTTPNAGTVEISESGTTTTPTPAGYSLLGLEVSITAPPASAADPLRIVFDIRGSRLPAGGVDVVDVFRDGAVVPGCDAGQIPAGQVACVLSRETVDGNGRITILAVEASLWNFGVAQPAAPPPPGGGEPGPGDPGPGDPGTSPPPAAEPALVSASVRKRMRMRKAVRRGVRVRIVNRADGSTDRVALLAPRRALRSAARRRKRVGRAVRRGQPAGRVVIRVKPRKKARRKLLRNRRVKMRVRIKVTAPGTIPTTVRRSIVLRR